MKQQLTLTIASLLCVVLVTFHIADDIARGFDGGGLSNLIVVPILVLWVYAALVLAERRSGYAINLLLSLLALVIPIIHLTGRGVGAGSRIAHSDGALFFIWTLIAIAVAALFCVILSARGLWNQRARSQ